MVCPQCSSPKPHLHPAVQVGGECHVCDHAFHCRVTPENTPERIREIGLVPEFVILTAEHLDEIEDCAREADRVTLTSDDVANLVAIARAAMAWSEARAAHRDVCNEPSYLTSLVADQIPTLKQYQGSIDALYGLLRGAQP